MPCLIFRATNERSISLSQTSSQAAIIPSRGSVLGRQKGGNVTSSDMPALYVFVCLYLSPLSVCVPAHSYLFFSSCLCHLVVSKQHPGAVWFLNHRKDFNNSHGSHFFLYNPQHLLITSLFWGSAHASQWGYYPNKWFSEVYNNTSASSKWLV